MDGAWYAEHMGRLANARADHFITVVGPIVGGWISETRLGWRFSFWIMFIVAALNALACLIITPETVSAVAQTVVMMGNGAEYTETSSHLYSSGGVHDG